MRWRGFGGRAAASLAMAVLLAMAGSIWGVATAVADVEPNDGITQAEGPLMAGITYEGALANAEDKDTYVFYVSGQQQLSVEVSETKSAPDEAYYCLDTYFGNSDNEPIAYEDQGAADFHYTTPPGINRFYLSIYNPYECEGGNSYTVRIEPAGSLVTGPVTLPRVPTTEPNEDQSQAVGPLLGNTAYTGEIQTQNDEDWFKFYTAPGTHQVDVAATPISERCSESGGAGSVEGPGISAGLPFGSDSGGRGQSVWNHAHFTSSAPGVYYIHFGTEEVFGGQSHCSGSAYEFVIEPPDAVSATPPGRAHKGRRGYAVAGRFVSLKGRQARVRLWCKGAGKCKGWLKLIGRAGRRRVPVGHARFAFGQKRSLVLRVKLSRGGSNLLHRSRRGRLRLKLIGRNVRNRTVVLGAPRRNKRHARRSARAAASAGRLKVRMINPFYEGIAVVPPKIRYFDNTNNLPPIVHDLNWHSWGGPRAEATGLNEKSDPVEVALSARRRCGLSTVRFYTRITVDGSTYPLQCQVRMLSGENIGAIAEDVSDYDTSFSDVSIPKGRTRAEAYELRWSRFGRPTMTGRGVSPPWWTFPDFRWAPAKLTLSKLGYCRQRGAIAYLKARLVIYGNGIEIHPGDRVQRHAKKLRSEVGKPGPRHVVQYNYRKWCKQGEAYPEEVWKEWR